MGTYVIQLVVNDSHVDCAPDTVTVTVKPTKATVVQDLATLKKAVNNLPNSAFRPGAKLALLALLNTANGQIALNRYVLAATTLKSLVPRIDGCASAAKQPDKNDWIANCAAQTPVYSEVNYLIQELQALQGS